MKKIFLCMVGINIFFTCHSQVLPAPLTVPTPNAANLGLYGDVPVSHYTGVPNINIPLHTITSEHFTVPISISYHAGGFRPEIHPSWIGNGWSFNAGGAITRIVRDRPDEYNDAFAVSPNSHPLQGFYYTNALLNNSNWHTVSTNEVNLGAFKDREPDIFKFNVLGKSGSFFLNHEGEWSVQSDEYFRVEFDPIDFKSNFFYVTNPGSVDRKTFNKFTLIDKFGVKYVFGTDSAIEYSVGLAHGYEAFSANAIATTWYLTSIVPPSGYGVDFTYKRGPYQTSFGYYQYSSTCFTDFAGKGFLGKVAYVMNNGDSRGLSGSIQSPVYLSSISSPKENLVISFHTSNSNELKYSLDLYKELHRIPGTSLPTTFEFGFQLLNLTNQIPYFSDNPSESPTTYVDYNISKFKWLKLDQIEFKYSNSILTHQPQSSGVITRKKVSFSYLENSSNRLRLNSMAVSDLNEADIERYEFTYDQRALPDYISEITDHWGFSNGTQLAFQPSTGYPWVSNLLSARNSVPDKSLHGLLKQIKYPTGGTTEFVYENHTYEGVVENTSVGSTILPGHGTTGGARIKKIITKTATTKPLEREFFYITNSNTSTPFEGSSSGILERNPKYDFYTFSTGGSNIQYKTVSSSYVPISSVFSGNHVTYSTVVEKLPDNSYSVYKYTNQANIKDVIPVNLYEPGRMSYIPYASKEFERGKLLSEEHFSSDKKLISKKEIEYDRINDDNNHKIRAISLDFTYCWGYNTTASNFPCLAAYYHYTHFYLPISIKDYFYKGTEFVLSKKDIEYDIYGNIVKEIKNESDGTMGEKRFTYANNHTGTIFSNMISKNMVGIPITVESYKNNVFIHSTRYNFSQFTAANFIKISSVEQKIKSNPYEIVESYLDYDSNGNLLQVEKNDGTIQSYIWGYGKRWLVGIVANGDYNTVAAQLNMANVDWPNGNEILESEFDGLRVSLPNAFITSHIYSFYGDLISTKDLNGEKTTYAYDDRGRLSTIKDKDGNVLDKIAYKLKETVAFPFKNSLQSQILTRSNVCPTGYYSLSYLYEVEAGKYGSFVSQQDADDKAIYEINTIGQDYVNANGECVPYFLYTSCCNWGHMLANFEYNAATQTVNFTLILYRNNGTSAYGQIATLDGLLFRPSSSKYVSVSTSGWSGSIAFDPTGEVRIMGSSITTTIQVSGSYSIN